MTSSKASEILTKEFLFQEYTVNNKSNKQISEETGFTVSQVQNRLIRLKIQRNRTNQRLKDLNYINLNQLYLVEEKTTYEIADIFKVSPSSVQRMLHVYNIPLRSRNIDIVGKTFGKLKVIESLGFEQMGNKKEELFKCMCCCGNTKTCRKSRLLDGRNTSCRCENGRGKYNRRFKGYEEISGQYWKSIINGAIQRNLVFEIPSIKSIWELFLKQDRKCALTGLDLEFLGENQPSLDRIDSSIGYIMTNIQWVDSRINQMKWQFPEKLFISLCKKVSDYNE